MLSQFEENLEKLRAALVFYDELQHTKEATPDELSKLEIKREYVKKEILSLTMQNKKLLHKLEYKYIRGVLE